MSVKTPNTVPIVPYAPPLSIAFLLLCNIYFVGIRIRKTNLKDPVVTFATKTLPQLYNAPPAEPACAPPAHTR